jgi:hypothetical protein
VAKALRSPCNHSICCTCPKFRVASAQGQLSRSVDGGGAGFPANRADRAVSAALVCRAEMLAPSRACLQFLAPLAQTYIDSGGEAFVRCGGEMWYGSFVSRSRKP